MGYALIWVESLASVLVLLALVTAVAARWRFGPRAVPILVALLLVALAAGATAGLCYFHLRLDAHPISNPQSIALIGWTLFLAAGAVVVLAQGLRRPGPEPAARAWSRPRLFLALAVLVVVTTITFSNMDLAVKIQLSAVRAEAGAKMLAQLPPRVPDAENAAVVYQAAFDLLAPPEPVPPLWRDQAPDAWKEYDRSAFDPKDKDFREFLRTQERGLALVRKAAAMPACSFEHDYFLWIAMPLPEVQRLRHAATMLAYDALAKAADGDVRGALDDVAAIYGVAGHVNDPLLVVVMAAAGIEKTGAKVLEDVLSLTAPAPADLGRLPLADTVSYRRAVRRAMATEEVAFGLATFTGLASQTADDPPVLEAMRTFLNDLTVATLGSSVYRVFYLADDLAAYRRAMHEMQQLAAKPYYEARPAWEAFEQSWKVNRRGVITALITPSTDKAVVAATEGDAERLLARTALALTAFKAKTGAYPDKLDALVPDLLPRVPLDPFSGRSLRLKRDGTGLVIYSVGRDLTDDGGRPAAPGQDGGDLVFRLR